MFSYVLIGVGMILVVISFFISEKIDEKLGKNGTVLSQQSMDIWNENDEKNVRERIEAIMVQSAEAAILKTDDQLSRISNEKIMAVSEFSDQILEKLEQNHSEVVFLYNMLGEKKEEIKKLMQESAQPMMEEEPEEKVETEVVVETEEAISQKVEKKTVSQDTGLKAAVAQMTEKEVKTENQNERILQLYNSGKSVLEISKELSLGQGEVKLVIDLFQGGKK